MLRAGIREEHRKIIDRFKSGLNLKSEIGLNFFPLITLKI